MAVQDAAFTHYTHMLAYDVMCLFDQNLGTQERGVQVAQPIPKQPSLPSTHLWLKGLAPKHASVDDVHVAFCQWLGDNGKQLASQTPYKYCTSIFLLSLIYSLSGKKLCTPCKVSSIISYYHPCCV